MARRAEHAAEDAAYKGVSKGVAEAGSAEEKTGKVWGGAAAGLVGQHSGRAAPSCRTRGAPGRRAGRVKTAGRCHWLLLLPKQRHRWGPICCIHTQR